MPPKRKKPSNTPPNPDIQESLHCPLCLGFFIGKIFQCHGGFHNICGTCFFRLPHPQKCPYCRKDMESPIIRNIALENIAGKFPVTCKWRDCGHVCLAKDMEKHQNQCPMKPKICGVFECEWKGYDIEKHCKEEHGDITTTLGVYMDEKGYLVEKPFRLDIPERGWPKDGTQVVVYKGNYFFLHWRHVDSERMVLVRIFVTSFDEVDGDDENPTYTLKVDHPDCTYTFESEACTAQRPHEEGNSITVDNWEGTSGRFVTLKIDSV